MTELTIAANAWACGVMTALAVSAWGDDRPYGMYLVPAVLIAGAVGLFVVAP